MAVFFRSFPAFERVNIHWVTFSSPDE